MGTTFAQLDGVGSGRESPPARMVQWYNPRQLLRTAGEVAASTVLGRHSDHRLIEALGDKPKQPFHELYGDASDGTIALATVDFVADTGDGWNPTYAIAQAVAAPQLDFVDSHGTTWFTRRADALVFGGDEIYPTPSRNRYQRQLVNPYECALRKVAPPRPRVFAVPGNHDWYDSLAAFTRIFCARDRFGSWSAPQERSYFALRLPRRWWLIATDIQLGSDLDRPQIAYFQEIAKLHMKRGDQIILCNAVPDWIYAALYGRFAAETYNENNLAFIESKIFPDQHIRVALAGDLHHYRRHASGEGVQKITAGGGGAFLHPTHELDPGQTLDGGFTHQCSFPDQRDSWRLCWRNLCFPFLNPWFGLVPAALYVLSQQSWWAALLLVGALVFFTDTHSQRYRWIAGPLHGVAHLSAATALLWIARGLFETAPDSYRELACAGFVAVGGGIVGSFLMGFYLLVSLNGFGRHANEAFSALRIQDYKCFLRMQIRPDGSLVIFPIGLRRVPRSWRRRDVLDGGPLFESSDPKATGPELIEDPIVLQPESRAASPSS